MTAKAGIAELIASLRRFRGAVCWDVVAGQGPGPQVKLDLGAKVRRDPPVGDRRPGGGEQPDEPNQEQYGGQYEGLMGILVHCAWRLAGEEIVCGSAKDDEPDCTATRSRWNRRRS